MEPELSYEEALARFDERLRALEDGKLSLDEAIAAVDDARRYLKICEAKLEEAKGKLETRPSGSAPPVVESPDVEPPERDLLL